MSNLDTFKKVSMFIHIVEITCVTVLLLVVMFNWIIDPYGILNSPTIHGFNQLKPEKISAW